MPVTSVFWAFNAPQDVHLIPGYTGPRLDHLLFAAQTVGAPKRADTLAAPITVTFAANFAAGPKTAHVAVSAQGEVAVTPPPAAPFLLDFVVTATVTEGANTFTANKRFRIHAGITRMWLTPATLTVHQNVRNARFTIIAEFTDGTYGDITPWCPWNPPAAADRTYVRQTGSNTPAITWTTSAAGTTGVHADTGALTGAANAGTATITAALLPLPAPANSTATGTAQAAKPWSDPVTLTLIDGPGFAAMANAPNVLILPDGFKSAADKASFEQVARHLAQRLRVRHRTSPYNLLKDKMNYFMAWIPSGEDGISPLEEVVRFNVAGNRADAVEQDTSVAAAGIPAAWNVANPPTPATNTNFLINERDTAFAVTLGERPRVDRRMQIRSGSRHPARYDENDFDDFLKALRDTGGTAVGATWARGGRDEQKVLILGRSNRTGGGNNFRQPTGRYVCMTLDRLDEHHIQDNALHFGKDLRADTVPAIAQIEIWTTAAHELGHSFTLEDEYGGRGLLPAARVNDVARGNNVHSRASLLTGANLDADKIKWRWPRLRKAGVISAAPTDLGGGKYRVTLNVGQGKPFVVDDVVRFRLRPLLTAPAPTDRFIVTSVAVDVLEVQKLTAAAFVPANFPAGTALIRPARAPDPDAPNHVFGADLELMHQSIRARINLKRNPLNAADGDPLNRPCPGLALPTPTPATNFPGAPPQPPNPPAYSAWIVGLYENGFEFDCDVYRPTGVCIMRTLHYEDKPTKTESAYQFCPVCRYAMVDFIDPSKHAAIDDDYAGRYPT
ncbi:MAG TPA: hypothetical protein VH834_00010 [Solirubrobacteraceae bacterium]|jgi:hypothetical protein